MYGAADSIKGDAGDIEDAIGGKEYVFELPGHKSSRRRMNFVGIWLAFFIPYVLFMVVVSSLASKMRHDHFWAAALIVALCAWFVMAQGAMASKATYEKHFTEKHRPSWHVFSFWTSALALVLGFLLGNFIYYKYLSQYYDASSLSVYGGDPSANLVGGVPASQVAASLISQGLKLQPGYPSYFGPDSPVYGKGGILPTAVNGQQMMDAGAVYFAYGSYLDTSKAMSFGKGPKYCVVPISFGTRSQVVYDMWAAGVDCCGDAADPRSGRTDTTKPPTYFCGAVGDPLAHAGLRLMKDEQQHWMSLAVKQAEAAYGIEARKPIFFEWMKDPIEGDVSSKCSFGRYTFDANDTDVVTSPYQTGCGTQYGLPNDYGFLGLWPFKFSDIVNLGVGSSSGTGGGGLNSLYAASAKLQSMGTCGFFVLQALLVSLASCSFATLGFKNV